MLVSWKEDAGKGKDEALVVPVLPGVGSLVTGTVHTRDSDWLV